MSAVVGCWKTVGSGSGTDTNWHQAFWHLVTRYNQKHLGLCQSWLMSLPHQTVTNLVANQTIRQTHIWIATFINIFNFIGFMPSNCQNYQNCWDLVRMLNYSYCLLNFLVNPDCPLWY